MLQMVTDRRGFNTRQGQQYYEYRNGKSVGSVEVFIKSKALQRITKNYLH
jgi:hypothetical protein